MGNKDQLENKRILAQDQYRSNDTRKTNLNNNDLIIGPTGAGKTRNYVKPNILQANESMVITDTKGNLRREFTPYLESKGYTVYDIDLIDAANSPCGYNPLDKIRYDASSDSYSEADITSISAIICPVRTKRDPFWEDAAKQYLECLLAYVFQCLPANEHTMSSVGKLFRIMNTKAFDTLFSELIKLNPDCLASRRYKEIVSNRKADRTDACIRAFLGERLKYFTFEGCDNFYNSSNKLAFNHIGQRKTAVFLTVSDNDRSTDVLVNLFYTDALQSLIKSADNDYEDNRLPIPVRFIFDDFATNTIIPDFDQIISVIRSREIYVSLIVQSLSQFFRLYDQATTYTIINNCDNWLYLGGQDVKTAEYLSLKYNKSAFTILNMELNQALLFTRGSKPVAVEKFNLTEHPEYPAIAQKKASAFEAFRPTSQCEEDYPF